MQSNDYSGSESCPLLSFQPPVDGARGVQKTQKETVYLEVKLGILGSLALLVSAFDPISSGNAVEANFACETW